MEIPSIPEFYAHQHLFLTGATGFLGKVIVEKLLRDCSDIEKIYVLVRSKRNKTGAERWRETTENEIFDRLKSEKPGILEEKVAVVDGDVKELHVGLSAEDYRMLQERVSIVIHSAATVSFNQPLPEAILMNLRGTREMVQLALGMRNLKVFAHISTTFCHPHLQSTGEEFYRPPMDWKKAIKFAEELGQKDLIILKDKVMGNFPNTYTFTKNLAEDLLRDHLGQLPLVIVRPSIVIPASEDPICGWHDNLNGPAGLCLVSSTGLVRHVRVNCDAVTCIVPVDVAVSGLIVATWHRGISTGPYETPIYNVTCAESVLCWGDLVYLGLRFVSIIKPNKYCVWKPEATLHSYSPLFKISAILVHLIPAIFLDFCLKLAGKTPLVMKIQIKTHTAGTALYHFSRRNWDFPSENYDLLVKQILPVDQDKFHLSFNAKTQAVHYFVQCTIHSQKTFLKQTPKMLPAARKRFNRLVWLDRIIKISLRGFIVWTIYKYYNAYLKEYQDYC